MKSRCVFALLLPSLVFGAGCGAGPEGPLDRTQEELASASPESVWRPSPMISNWTNFTMRLQEVHGFTFAPSQVDIVSQSLPLDGPPLAPASGPDVARYVVDHLNAHVEIRTYVLQDGKPFSTCTTDSAVIQCNYPYDNLIPSPNWSIRESAAQQSADEGQSTCLFDCKGSDFRSTLDVTGVAAVESFGAPRVFRRNLYGSIESLQSASWSGDSWADAGNLGGNFHSPPAVAQSSDRLFLVGRGADDAAWIGSTSDGSQWTPWRSLGGALTTAAAIASYEGVLYVFGIGLDNALWVTTSADDGATWSAWSSIGGLYTSAPAAVVFEDFLLVFAVGSDGALWETALAPAVLRDANPWTTPTSLGGFFTSAPAAAVYQNKLNVFARGGDGAVWALQYDPSSRSWTSGASLGGHIQSAPAVAALADGLLLLARGDEVHGDTSETAPLWQRHGSFERGWESWVASPGGGQL